MTKEEKTRGTEGCSKHGKPLDPCDCEDSEYYGRGNKSSLEPIAGAEEAPEPREPEAE